MPMMTRQEVIDKLGFDPGIDPNTTIYQKDDPDQEPITLNLPKEKQPELSQGPIEQVDPNPNRETPTGPLSGNMVSGSVRGWLSDPLLLSGLVIAGFNAAATDKTFQQSLYKEGGFEALQDHLREKQKALQEEHPDASPKQIQNELLKYQASPEFTNFHIDQMGSVYGTGYKLAWEANKLMGVNKTPEQETYVDNAAQILGSVVLPSPGIVTRSVAAIAQALGRTTPRAAEVIARGADVLVLPGTSVEHYSLPTVAASAAVGTGVQEIVRGITGEPNITRGNAFTPRDPDIGGPLQPDSRLPPDARPAEVVGALGGAAAVAALLARALRGRPNVDLNPIDSGAPRIEQQIIDARTARGIEPVYEPGIVRRIDEAINTDAILEQQARDAGDRAVQTATNAGLPPNVTRDTVEREVQTANGLLLSRASRRNQADLTINEGGFLDGTRAQVSLRDIINVAREMPQQDVDLFRFGIVARNVEDTRLAGLHESTRVVTEAQNAVQRALRSGQPNRIQQANDRLVEAIDAHNRRLQDDPTTRPNMAGWDDARAGTYVADMMANPNARRLHDMYVTASREINNQYAVHGTRTAAEVAEMNRRPWHTAMFEARGVRYDPTETRNVLVDNQITPNATFDPFSSLALKATMMTDEVMINNHRRRVVDALIGADPQGHYIRDLGPTRANMPGTNPGIGRATVYRNGVEHTIEFSRPAVAEALKAAPLTLGTIAQGVNKFRHVFQQLTTGPLLGGIPTALQSVAYDTVAAYATRRAGRSFGYLGMAARMIAGDNRVANQIIDSIDFLDPTSALQVASWIVRAPIWRVQGRVGQMIVDAAMRQHPIMQQIGTPQQWQNIGAHMVRAYETSTVGIMRRLNANHAHAMMADAYGAKSSLERAIAHYNNAAQVETEPLRRAINIVAEPYMGLIDSIHNAGRYAFFAQNYALLRRRYNGNPPRAEVERLAEEARRSAGDIQQMGSNKKVQQKGQTFDQPGAYNSAMAYIPYGNITVQATRHLYHAAFAQGSKHSLDVGLRIAALGYAAYASYDLVRQMGGNEWYWNVLNDFERIGVMRMPNAEAIYIRAKTGEWPQIDMTDPEKYFMRIRMAAELVPYMQAIMSGLEAASNILGMPLIDRGLNRGQTTSMGDIGSAIATAGNVGNIPALNLALIAGGVRSDFMNPARGRSAIQQLAAPRGQGVFKGQTPGGIDVRVAETIKTILGLAGDIGIAMTDAAFQNMQQRIKDNKGHADFMDALDSVHRGLQEGAYKVAERYPSVPGLWRAPEKVYMSNPVNQRVFQIEKMQKQLDEQWRMEFGQSQINYPNRPRVQDPDVGRILAISHAFLSKGAYKQYRSMLDRTNAAITSLDASKANKSPGQIEVEKRRLMIQARAEQGKLMDMIDMEDGMLKSQFSHVFKRYNLDPKIDNVVELTRRATR